MTDALATHDRRSPAALLALALVILTLLTFGRIVTNRFVNWDDPHTIAENPKLNPPTLRSIAAYWNPREPAAGLWAPLTYTVWGLLSAAARRADGSLSPVPFHVTNLLLHTTSALLVFVLLRRTTRADWPSFLGAAAFAVHPFQVEAVAWASGLKDMLAGMLALAAIVCHVFAQPGAHGNASPDGRFALNTLGFFAFTLAVLAKASAVVALPIALVIDLRACRPTRPRAGALALWAAVSIPVLWIARSAQEIVGLPHVPIWQRPLVAADAVAFYLMKLVLPLRLALDYGRTPAVVIESGAAYLTWIIPAVLVAAIAWSRSRLLAAAVLIFVAGLSTNLGLVPFQFQFCSTVADHYAYVSMLGLALAVACGVRRLDSTVARIATLCLVLTWAALSFVQAGRWCDSRTLFTHAVSVNPDSPAMRNNLGTVLAEAGELTAAEEQFRAAQHLAPTDPSARQNLANLARLRAGSLPPRAPAATRSSPGSATP